MNSRDRSVPEVLPEVLPEALIEERPGSPSEVLFMHAFLHASNWGVCGCQLLMLLAQSIHSLFSHCDKGSGMVRIFRKVLGTIHTSQQ